MQYSFPLLERTEVTLGNRVHFLVCDYNDQK